MLWSLSAVTTGTGNHEFWAILDYDSEMLSLNTKEDKCKLEEPGYVDEGRGEHTPSLYRAKGARTERNEAGFCLA